MPGWPDRVISFTIPFPAGGSADLLARLVANRMAPLLGVGARAVAAKFKRDSGLDYAPEEILVSTEGKQVIYDALIATINAGDKVIIPTPCWVSYPDIVGLADGTPVLLPCGPNQGFKLQPDQLEAAITPRTKWLIVNTPSNPTGATYSAAELRALCDVLLRHPQVHILPTTSMRK